ncbi:MAG: glycosyltransferase family 2 protein [Patescibacteria group bacterium]
MALAPKVAVIYLTYNTAASAVDIPDCLRTLEQVDYPLDRWRVVIVENPSKHGASHPMIERDWKPKAGKTLPDMSIHLNECDVGFAGACNVGFEAAKQWGADYVYLLNQDAVVDPHFLKTVVAYAEAQPNAAVVQSRIMLKQSPELYNTRGNAFHYLGFGFSLGYREPFRHGEASDSQPFFYASGAGVLVRVKATETIGLFEPSYYMYHEDVDLSWRARLAGFTIGYAEDSVIYHRYEFSKSIRKFYWMERNRHLTNLVNYRWRTLCLIAPLAFVMECGTLLFAFRSGWWREKLKSWGHFLKPSTWGWIMKRRGKLRTIRRCRDQELLPFMTGQITNQETNSFLMRLVNPIFARYFSFLKRVVRW